MENWKQLCLSHLKTAKNGDWADCVLPFGKTRECINSFTKTSLKCCLFLWTLWFCSEKGKTNEETDKQTKTCTLFLKQLESTQLCMRLSCEYTCEYTECHNWIVKPTAVIEWSRKHLLSLVCVACRIKRPRRKSGMRLWFRHEDFRLELFVRWYLTWLRGASVFRRCQTALYTEHFSFQVSVSCAVPWIFEWIYAIIVYLEYFRTCGHIALSSVAVFIAV